MSRKQETTYQNLLKKKIEKLLPGCYITKNDANETQGVPDLLILHNNKWAMLEIKISKQASKRPNQEYYINKFNEMSYAAFVYPENEDEGLDALQRTLKV